MRDTTHISRRDTGAEVCVLDEHLNVVWCTDDLLLKRLNDLKTKGGPIWAPAPPHDRDTVIIDGMDIVKLRPETDQYLPEWLSDRYRVTYQPIAEPSAP